VAERIEHLISLVPELKGRGATISKLDGGLTNCNFRVDTDNESYVVRIAGDNSSLLGIDRQCEYECTRLAARLDAGADVISFLRDQGALVTRFLHGHVLSADDIKRRVILERLTVTLKKYHHEPSSPGYFSAFDTVRKYHALAKEHHVSLPPSLDVALDRFLHIEEVIQRHPAAQCPCHNDLLPANFIDDGKTIRIIDWEYAGIGDLFFDLGNLASNSQFEREDEELLLELYFGQVMKPQLQKLQLMRLASDMRESMWGFLQVGISKLDIDYASYGNEHLEKFLSGYENLAVVNR